MRSQTWLVEELIMILYKSLSNSPFEGMYVTYLKTHHCLVYLTMDSWTWIHESMIAIYSIR